MDERDRTAFAAFVRLVEATSQFEFLDVRKYAICRNTRLSSLSWWIRGTNSSEIVEMTDPLPPRQLSVRSRAGGRTGGASMHFGCIPLPGSCIAESSGRMASWTSCRPVLFFIRLVLHIALHAG